MSDLIDRQAVFDALIEKGQNSKRYKLGEFWELNLSEIIEAINAIPSAEPERKKGEWEEGEWIMHKMLSRDYGKIYYQHDCSCNLYESPYPFCPNCGMKMKRGDR